MDNNNLRQTRRIQRGLKSLIAQTQSLIEDMNHDTPDWPDTLSKIGKLSYLFLVVHDLVRNSCLEVRP